MILKQHLLLTLYSFCGILLKGSQGSFPITQNVTVVEGGTANLTCRVDHNDNTSLQWSNPAQQTLYFGDKKALRNNRIELVRFSWHELIISITDVTLSDEGQYTCSVFTMPVKTSKSFLTVLGVPEKPEIAGFTKPALEKDTITLTCNTSGSKPAADIRWFKNDKEIKGVKEVNASGKTFTVKSILELKVDRNDDGVTITCRVDHESHSSAPQLATQVLQVHYAPIVKIIPPTELPQEGHYLTLVCDFNGNPIPEPVIWTKDGGELPDPNRMTVNGRELTIAFLNKTDNGTYRCEASNSIGQDSAEYPLFVCDFPTTLSPSTTTPPQTTTTTTTVSIETSAASPSTTDPNALADQAATDHAVIGGVVAVVVFITLCLIIVLGRYLARHKGTYLTNEAKGAEDAPDADTAIINAEGNQANADEKKEYFI
ncbi:cell adhesion molecule 2-like isoform X2 [Polyodon spathula]|uniref:cell adhesion molecule 2-like isoform X2 n=1 Tax=Polyodon spathula TaxID=7913 RepID=UPI001B7ED2CB|nr:cell adhesion molecule 2-like isoform X2 [Polyodon spathula]